MSTTTITPPQKPPRQSLMQRLVLGSLDTIERVGNKLPDPVTLFLIMIGLVMIASWIATTAALSATHPGTGAAIVPENLFARDMVQRIFIEMPRTFALFPPLGLVLAVMLGIGVAERTGLVATALKAFIGGVTRVAMVIGRLGGEKGAAWTDSLVRSFITSAVVFAGLMSSLAADAGYVVLIPLGAVIFHNVGRHPMAGLAAAFAGVSGGFSSNLLLTLLDPLLAGFTTPAAQILDPAYAVDPTANYYLMIALVPAFTIAGAWVTQSILEPRLGRYRGEAEADGDQPITPRERRGLAVAGLVTLATLAVIALLVIPENAILRNPEGELLVDRIGPFLNGMVAIMLFFFFLPGLAYGIVTGSIRSDRDVARMTAESMSSMGAYIVLAFVAAHLVAFFNWSNMGVIMAISGADFLKSVNFTGIPLIVSFVFIAGVINLFIGSASAKWAIMAPVFVPMFMLLGYSPELTQAAYRIGDSFTNILTPLMQYFPLVIIFAQKYDKDYGIGTIASAMLPYSVAFGFVGVAMLIAWLVFGFPLGPGAPIFYAN